MFHTLVKPLDTQSPYYIPLFLDVPAAASGLSDLQSFDHLESRNWC